MRFEALDLGRSQFITRILEPGDNSLVIELCGGLIEKVSAEERKKRLDEAKDALERLHASSNKVFIDNSAICRITFDSYVIYQVMNESYDCGSPEGPIYKDRKFRVFEESEYLTFSERFANFQLAQSYNGAVPIHYGIWSENHIVDVISCEEPIVDFVQTMEEKESPNDIYYITQTSHVAHSARTLKNQ